jgi:hypothetical protein
VGCGRNGSWGIASESEWVVGRDCGDLQSRAECAGFDAASGAGGGGFAGIGGWVGGFPVAGDEFGGCWERAVACVGSDDSGGAGVEFAVLL